MTLPIISDFHAHNRRRMRQEISRWRQDRLQLGQTVSSASSSDVLSFVMSACGNA